ncbi:MAG: hypothetical protein ACSLE2_08755 [Lysobacterales bacterium]
MVGQLHGQCAIWSGRRFRTFNVTDDFNGESLRIDIDTSQPFPCVIRTRDELMSYAVRLNAVVWTTAWSSSAPR